jgi:hypothetical protein
MHSFHMIKFVLFVHYFNLCINCKTLFVQYDCDIPAYLLYHSLLHLHYHYVKCIIQALYLHH